MGDFNRDLLKLHTDQNVRDFFNLMTSYSFNPLHSVPTRVTPSSTSLIDNIFTNDSQEFLSGVLIFDISDHFPVFTISKFVKLSPT